jgi:hypothetical protein
MSNNQICGTWNNRLETVKITVIEVEDLIKQLKLEGFEKE